MVFTTVKSYICVVLFIIIRAASVIGVKRSTVVATEVNTSKSKTGKLQEWLNVEVPFL